MYILPNRINKRIVQNNKSDIYPLSDIWSSFNLDLSSNEGLLRVSPRLLIPTPESNALTTAPCAFKRFSDDGGTTYRIWTVSGTQVYKSYQSAWVSGWLLDDISGTPTNLDVTKSDIELAFNNLYVSTDDNKLYKLTSAGVWSNFTIGASDTNSHPMWYYADSLYYVRSKNIIYSIDSSNVVTLEMTLGSVAGDESQQIVWGRVASNKIWLGTLNRKGGKGEIHEWDGVSTQVTRSYRLQSGGALACVIKDDIPYVMDTDGKLLAFNGSTFQEIARLPLNNLYLKNAFSSTNNRFIHPNGMSVIDGKINILINNEMADSGATILENVPSGVWEYDFIHGLYHKYSISNYKITDSSITDYGHNRVSAVGALAETKVFSVASTSNGDFMAGVLYYTNASSTAARVFINDRNDTLAKYGYFVTDWFPSSALKDVWQKIFFKYRKFLNSGDKIIAKYRTNQSFPTEINLTWDNSTSTFKTTTDLSSSVGSEVEIIQGTGAGKCAHISSVSLFGTDYFVNLDDTFTGVTTGTAKARVQSWTKLGEITGQTTESWVMPIGVSSERIQIKVCMQFTGKNEIQECGIINKIHSNLE